MSAAEHWVAGLDPQALAEAAVLFSAHRPNDPVNALGTALADVLIGLGVVTERPRTIGQLLAGAAAVTATAVAPPDDPLPIDPDALDGLRTMVNGSYPLRRLAYDAGRFYADDPVGRECFRRVLDVLEPLLEPAMVSRP